MRAQLQQASGEIPPRNNDFQIDETVLDVHMKQAIARMLDWCARSPNVATFMARGFVVDTLSDISTQITDYFPRSINVMPIIDDLSFVVAQSARRTGQRYQEVALDYISDGKIPEAAQANKQSFVKWYSVENVIGGDFDGHAKKLRPGWSGGAGSPTDMLKHLNLGTKKGFLLQVNALDIQDAKTQSLGAHTGIMQAMGGSAAAMKEAGDVAAAGGVEATKAQTVIEALVEIKTIRAALTQAGDTPQAAPLAAALALKTDALSTTMGQIKLPAAMQAETARIVETVRVDMSAKQITTALQTIVNNMPAIVTARPANDGAGPAGLASQMVKSITTLQIASQTANMPMREVIALALTKQAPPALADAVKAVTTQLARKEALPVLDRLLPPAAAVTIRSMLTTPALKTVAQTPVSVAPVVAQIKALVAQMANPAQTQTPVQAGATKAAATPVTDATAPKGATPIASAPAPVGLPASVVATTGPATNTTPAVSVPKGAETSAAAVAPVSVAPVLNVVSSAKGAFAQPAAAPVASPSAPVVVAVAAVVTGPAVTIAPVIPAAVTTQPSTPIAATPTTTAPAALLTQGAVPANTAPTVAVATAASANIPAVAATGTTPVVVAPPVAAAVSTAPAAITPSQPTPAAPVATASIPVSIPTASVTSVAVAPAKPATTATPAIVSAPQVQPLSPSLAFVVAAPAQPAPAQTPQIASVLTAAVQAAAPAPQASAQQEAAAAVTAPATAPVTPPAMQSYEAPVATAPTQTAPATPDQPAPVRADLTVVSAQPEVQRVEAPPPANTNIAPSTQVEGVPQEPKLRVVIDPVEAQHVVEPSASRNMAEETVKMAADVLNDSKNAPPQSGAEMAQAVADNLQVVANNPVITDATRSKLAVLVAEAQVVGQQAKNGQYVPDIPQQPTLLNPQAPLAEMTRAVDVKTPTGVTEPTEAVARHMDMLRNDANIARQNMDMPASNDQASPFSIKTTPKATEADKAKEEVKKGCGDCKNGFNCATCGTQTPAEKKQTDANLSAAEKALHARNAELGHNRPAMS